MVNATFRFMRSILARLRLEVSTHCNQIVKSCTEGGGLFDEAIADSMNGNYVLWL